MNKKALAYQKEKEELLTKEQKGKLKNQTVKSIKSWTYHGDTTIVIVTDNYLVRLGANDLGAWLEKIEEKNDKNARRT